MTGRALAAPPADDLTRIIDIASQYDSWIARSSRVLSRYLDDRLATAAADYDGMNPLGVGGCDTHQAIVVPR